MLLKERMFHINDLFNMNIQEQQKWILDKRENTQIIADMDFVHTLTDEEEIICIVGVAPDQDGNGEVFSIMSTNFRHYALTLFRMIKSLLARLHLLGFEKLTTVVPVDFKEAHRWCKMIGFKETGKEKIDYFDEKVEVVLYERTEYGN